MNINGIFPPSIFLTIGTPIIRHGGRTLGHLDFRIFYRSYTHTFFHFAWKVWTMTNSLELCIQCSLPSYKEQLDAGCGFRPLPNHTTQQTLGPLLSLGFYTQDGHPDSLKRSLEIQRSTFHKFYLRSR